MDKRQYEFFEGENEDVFIFYSTGKKGTIKKVVEFEYLHSKIRNIVLYDEIEGFRTTKSETNNGDVYIVLNTVAVIIEYYTNRNAELVIHIMGSDEIRNTAYHGRLIKALRELGTMFMFWGQKEESGSFEEFNESEKYLAFLVKRIE